MSGSGIQVLEKGDLVKLKRNNKSMNSKASTGEKNPTVDTGGYDYGLFQGKIDDGDCAGQFFGSSPCAQIEVLVVGKDSKDGDIKMHSIHMPENELVSYKEDGEILYPKFTNQQSKYYDAKAQEKLENLQTRANMHDLAKQPVRMTIKEAPKDAGAMPQDRRGAHESALEAQLTEQNARNRASGDESGKTVGGKRTKRLKKRRKKSKRKRKTRSKRRKRRKTKRNK